MLDYSIIIVWLLWWAGWIGIGFNKNPNSHSEPLLARLPHLVPLLVGPVVLFTPAFVTQQYPFGWEEADRWLVSILVLAGLGITCWARYHLGKQWSGLVTTKVNHELVTTGPYKYVRHPIYSGIILAVIGSALAVNTLCSVIGAVIWISTYVIKLSHEEKLLSQTFGVSWMLQCDKVYDKLIPGVY